MKHRFKFKKCLIIFELAIIFLGVFSGALSGILTPINSQQTVYAKSSGNNKDNKNNKDDKKTSSNKNSGSSSSKNGNDPSVSKMEGKLDQKNNVENSSFPQAAKEGIIKGAAPYNQKMQLLVTYAYLVDSYGSGQNYGSIYSNGKTLIQKFNSAAPGISFPQTGEANAVQNLTNSTKKKDSTSTKAQKIATSTYPSDQSDAEKAKWISKNELGQMAMKIAKPLAENGITATGLSGSRNPYIHLDSDAGKDTNSLQNAGSDIGNGAMAGLNGAKNIFNQKNNLNDTYTGSWFGGYVVGGSYNDFNSAGNQNHLSNSTIQEPNLSSNTWLNNLQGQGSLSGKSSALQQVIAIGIMDSLADKSGSIKSESDFKKYLEGLSASNYGRNPVTNDSQRWNDEVGYGKGTLSTDDEGDYNAGNLVEVNFENGTTSVNKGHATFIKNYPGFSPSQVEGVGIGKLGAWGQHYKKYMDKKTSASPSDDDWKQFQKFAKENHDMAKDADSALKGTKVLSWSPVFPYWGNSKASGDAQGKTENGSNTNNGFKKNSSGTVNLTNSMFFAGDSGNLLYSKDQKTAPQLALGADGSDVITDDESIYNYTHLSQSKELDKHSSISNGYSKAYSSSVGGFSSSNDIDGYDSYGDVIDGEHFRVIIPYWNNNTVKALENSPVIRTNTNDFGLPKSLTGEAGASDAQIKNICGSSKEAYNLAEKAKKALKNTGSDTLSQQISKVNSAVGSGGGSSNTAHAAATGLSNNGAAAEAILITAGTGPVDKDGKPTKGNKIASFNSNFINKAVKARQLYIGNSDTKSKADEKQASDQGSGTALYTATDIIQRIGLQTDYGSFDEVRKTIVSMIVSIYNSEFMQNRTQNIFSTDTFGNNGEMQRFGLAPYFYAMAFITFVLGIWTIIQYRQGKVRGTKFLTRFGKFIVVVLLLTSLHQIENFALNSPVDWAVQTPLKQQSVIDQWSKLKQEQDIKNVFYSSLFQDRGEEDNHSTDYEIPFYTSTLKNGEYDASVSDPMQNKNQIKPDTDQVTPDSITHSLAWRDGDGKVPLGTSSNYKTVNITLADLTNWASHMARQIYSAENLPGFQKGQADYEAPASGYDAGKEPLFAWLANNYQPIGTSGQGDQNNGKNGGANAKIGNKYGKNYPDKDYGTVRNPADTSIKSSYGSDLTGNQINNAAIYKNLNHYSEFAVNTKHYAKDSDISYGIDEDSDGGELTASQAFLKIWMSIFANSGANGSPGDANSFNSLMNFGQALNGNMGSQTTGSEVGQDNDGTGLTTDNVGQTGRNDLINEVSMTAAQRTDLNGGNGAFSHAAQQMIDAYQIPAGKSDYFNFDSKGSIIDVMQPYLRNGSKARDGLIFDLNKAMLNDYISDYAPIRAQINPSGANSSDDSGNNQADSSGVDPYTMAEDQLMAVDAFFRINQQLHYSMFPHGYEDNTIPLNTWNRMLFIPVSVMNKDYTNDQYNQDSYLNQSPVDARDNVVEYISLNTGVPSLFLFLLMNFALLAFGGIMTFIFKYVVILFIIFALIRNFFSPSNKSTIKGLLQGTIGLMFVFGMIKLGLAALIAYLSKTMNNNYVIAGGYTDLPVGNHSIIILVYLILVTMFLLKLYFPFVRRDIWTFGGGDGHMFRAIGGYSKQRWNNNPFRQRMHRQIINGWGARRKHHQNTTLKQRLGRKANNIKNILHQGRHPINSIMRKIQDKKLMAALSKGRSFFRRDKDTLASRVNDLQNARYGGVDSTISNGLDLDELRKRNITNGDFIDTINKGSADYDLGSSATGKMVQQLINQQGLTGMHVDGNHLIFDNTNSGMLKTAGGRKELFNNLIKSASARMIAYKDAGTGMLKKAPDKLVGMKQDDDNNLTIPVDNATGVSPDKLDDLLNNSFIKKNFDVLSSPVVHNGKYTNGKLELRPKNSSNSSQIISQLESNLSNFTGKDFKPNYTNSIDVGNNFDKNLLNKVALASGMRYINGKVYFNANNSKQLHAAQKLSNNLADNYRNHTNGLSNFIDGASDYVVNGAGHGFNAPRFTQSNLPGYVTQRFATNNSKRLAEGLKGLSNLANHAEISRRAYEAQQDFNRALINQFHSPKNLIDSYTDYARKNHMRFSQNTNNLIRNIYGTMDNYGPLNYDQLNGMQKQHVNHLMDKLNHSLAKDNQLNTLQNGISGNLDLPQQRKLANLRQELLKMSGTSDPNLFNKMTVGQIGDNAAQAASMKNLSIDPNGVLTGDIPRSMSSKVGQDRISSLIRGLSE